MTNNLYSRIDQLHAYVNAGEKQIHDVALECLVHALEHGNCTPADRLVKGFNSKNAYARACVIWFQTFSPIRWSGDGKVGILKDTAKLFTPYDVKGAQDTTVMDLAPKIQPYALTEAKILQVLQAIAKKIEKAEEGDESVKVVGDIAVIKAKLKAAMAAAA